MLNGLFTSESVTSGHPDKLCDLISDSILDAILKQDPYAHVACEVTASTGLIHVMGEITTSCYIDIEEDSEELEIVYDDQDDNLLEIDEALDDSMVKESNAVSFARR